ncbi:MAG TPA: hypothetical protein PK542_12120 [Treponemataceae bacterium]|nr:hypothetical protein [Treponemataceae bacterium]
MAKWHIAILGAFLLSALAISCASAPNAFSEKRPQDGLPCSVTLTLGASGSNGTFRIVGPFGAKTWLDGTATPDGSGNYLLEANTLHWFNNWTEGWTEATFECSGKFTLARNGERWSLAVKETPELGEPLNAGIRYRDTVLDPQTAARQFGNRWIRILAASEALRSSPLYAKGELPPYSAKHKKDRESTFVTMTGHYLFPETEGTRPRSSERNMKRPRLPFRTTSRGAPRIARTPSPNRFARSGTREPSSAIGKSPRSYFTLLAGTRKSIKRSRATRR